MLGACFLGFPSDTAAAAPLVLKVTSGGVPLSQVIEPDGTGAISLILDREEYDPLDVTGVALVRVQPGPAQASDLRVRLLLRNERGETVLQEDFSDLSGTRLDVTLKLDGAPLGNHTLHAILIDKAGTILAEATAPLRKLVKRKQLAEPDRQQVPVTVWPAEGAMEPDWPIMTGVSFPQGVLFNQERVRLLDDAGREIPCQTSVRSTWNRHGSIRWIGLDFVGRLTNPGAKYTLEFGKQVQRAAAREMEVVEDADGIHVNTGPLEFTVRKRGFNLVDDVRLNGELISQQDATAGLELTDHEGNVYRASNDPHVRVEIEESGPVRTTIRAQGWYVKDGTRGELLSPFLPTDKLCLHDTRITAYAGKPYVTVQHVLIVTFDTHKVRLRHIGISQRVEGASSGGFGLDGRAVAAPDPTRRSARLYQPASVDAQVESGVPEQADFAVVSRGEKGDGWATFGGPNGGLTLSVTDFWQLYPKELELTGDRISFNIWPRYGRTYTGVNVLALSEIYKAWWCHTGRELDFRMPQEVYDTLEADSAAADVGEYVRERGRLANAKGLAIENSFLLAFSSSDSQQDAARLNATYRHGPHAWADPQWVCDSLVFGYMTPKDVERFPTAEGFLEHAVALRLAGQDFARDYGMFNYFCFHADNSHFTGGRWGLNRVWNDHHGAPLIPWLLYVRSGDPKHLQLARRNSRHNMNVDKVHYVTPDYDLAPEKGELADRYGPRHVLGGHYGATGFQHWSERSFITGIYVTAAIDHLFWNYYTTGNRRALDVATVWIEAVRGQIRGVGGTGREWSATGSSLLEAYLGTWDTDLLESLDRVARGIGSSPFRNSDRGGPEGQHWVSFAPFIDRYLLFSGNATYRQRFLEWDPTNFIRYERPRPHSWAMRYYETGDTSHLEAILPEFFFLSLRHSPEPPRVTQDTSFYGWINTAYRVIQWQPYLRALVDADLPLFVARGEPDQPFPSEGRVVEQGGRSVCTIPAGTTARLRDSQVWYFRTAADQRTLELRVADAREGGVHIRTGDGARVLGQVGSDGWTAAGGEGTIRATVEPGALYYMAVAGGPSLMPVGYPLIVARTNDEWFDPAD